MKQVKTSNIQEFLDRIINQWRGHEDEIVADENKEVLILYTNGCSAFAIGANRVYTDEAYDSIYPITRSFLESYSQFKILCSFWGTPNFEDYFRFLLLEEMNDDRKAYNALVEDDSISDSQRKQSDLSSYYERFNNLFAKYFPNRIINQDDIVSSINKELNSLWKEYKEKYSDFITKGCRVQYALKNNNACRAKTGKMYDGISFVYRILSSESHSAIGALDSRCTKEGLHSINNYTDNILACINLIEICLNDIELEWSKLLV